MGEVEIEGEEYIKIEPIAPSMGWEKVGWLRIDVSQGYETPWGYGLAYWRWDCNKAVCYPLGINWLVWICREIYFRIKFTPRGIEHSSYTKGREMGYIYGFEVGLGNR